MINITFILDQTRSIVWRRRDGSTNVSYRFVVTYVRLFGIVLYTRTQHTVDSTWCSCSLCLRNRIEKSLVMRTSFRYCVCRCLVIPDTQKNILLFFRKRECIRSNMYNETTRKLSELHHQRRFRRDDSIPVSFFVHKHFYQTNSLVLVIFLAYNTSTNISVLLSYFIHFIV